MINTIHQFLCPNSFNGKPSQPFESLFFSHHNGTFEEPMSKTVGMGKGAKVLELNSTPSFYKAPAYMLSNLSRNRSLLKNLISRDFKVNYHGHILGYFWSLLEPLALTAIFYLVFVILRGDTDTLLPLKIMIGILIFNAFSRTLSSCTACLVSNAALIQQVYFPREIFPTAIAGFRLMTLLLSMIIVIPYMAFEQIAPTPTMFLLPVAMCSSILLAQGIGMMTASIQVRVRDTKQVVDLILRAAFFLSGVFFGAEHIPPEYLETFLLNPIAVYIEMARAAILGDMSLLSWVQISRAVTISLLAYVLGSIVFVKSERKAVKFL
ncbi:ABC transporter permease [Candidatus Poseidoniales archaeon]|nr:ABC transporter permease [Candidatus Poseidoniales archaeon]